MLVNVVLASLVAGAVLNLLRATRTGDRVGEVLSKIAASAAFVALGLVRWAPGDAAGTWLVAGLVLCAAGDVFLLWDRAFDLGLFTFLLGHVAYVGGFRAALPFSGWPAPLLVPMVLAGAVTFRWLWPRLGRRRIPVFLYIIAISVMLWGAVSTVVRGMLPWTAAVGAVLFYLSDLAVARDRFVRSSFLNRALGLPAYYLGQVFLASTIGSS
jgi:uncharacterized membrane protein YhhN